MDGIADLSVQTQPIRTENHPDCPLCGALGDVLYEGLRDRLFDVPGTWGFRHCSNTNCRHVWLDPQPIAADLPLIYETYYTHEGHETALLQAASRPLMTKVLRLPLKLAYAAFLRVTGITSARQKAYAMYLNGRTPGRLLEVGCGSGDRLAYFAKHGWEVVGQDVDPKAVEHARKIHGLDVHLGPLESLPETLGAFDAVIIRHVIEHVSSPTEFLRRAAAHIAPGGVLVAVTPNVESLGHWHFKENWYALDPPRHLHLFSTSTLSQVATEASLQLVQVTTSAANATGIGVGSWCIKRHGRHAWESPTDLQTNIIGILFQTFALLHHLLNRECGEECVLFARREIENSRPLHPLITEEN